MINIFDYSDYRKFIRDFQQTKCSVNIAFSYRYFAQKAGVNSSSFYTKIVKGERNLTKKTIFKTCIALDLKDQEAEYFENLVFFNQSNTIKEKNYFFEKLVDKQKLRNIKIIEEEQYEYFSEWYHVIIREAVTFLDFNGDYKKLANFLKPPIKPKQAKDSVAMLLKLGFLKYVDGKYIQTEPLIASDCSTDFKIHQIMNFQIKILNMTIEAFDRWKQSQRLTSATTFSISEKNMGNFVKILRDCRMKMMKLTKADDKPQQVYVLSINFYPMTDKNSKRGL